MVEVCGGYGADDVDGRRFGGYGADDVDGRRFGLNAACFDMGNVFVCLDVVCSRSGSGGGGGAEE